MSDRDLHERASSLFLELRDLSPPERLARLQAAAGSDLRLHREVLSLLEHDTRSADDPQASRDPRADAPADLSTPPGPTHIGPYRVLRRIGRGASGYVLLAQQDRPIQRRVAIKLVPHAVLSPELAARFDFERRALERTEHPNIARILDAGRTPDGLPFLVIEYVEGLPITQFCRERALPIRARITLLQQVIDAVQHAHQRGVIHRDLKPANILVGETGGRPLARVLDFGIAKPIPDAFDATAPVTVGQAMGTPAYMAPEQTGGRAIDTRADVYALGAILYELVAGRPPIEPGADAFETMRRVREVTPPPASRAAQPPASRALAADLDCILAKALEKDPGRRYPTAAALGDDLSRLLAGEPIAARPATLAYRASRFARRNRALVAIALLALFAASGGITGLTLGLIEAMRQRREASIQVDAQREINRFLTEDLLAAGTPGQQGENVRAIDLLRRASRRVDARFPDRPLIAAAIHHSLGGAFAELGDFQDAQHHLDRAIALRQRFAGPDAPDTVRSEIAAAGLLAAQEQLPEGHTATQAVVARARRLLGMNDPALYAALNDLGTIYITMDRGQDARAALEEALAGRQRLLGRADPLTLVTMSNLAQALDRLGQTQKSLDLDLEALGLADSLPDPPTMTVLMLCNNIGATYQDLNREREAEPYLRRAAELASSWIGPDNPATLTIQANLAGLEAKLGDAEQAARILEGVVAARTRIFGPDAADTLTARYAYWDAVWLEKRFDDAAAGFTSLLADIETALGEQHWLASQTRAILARALADGGRTAQALPYIERAAAEMLALYGPDHPRATNSAAVLARVRTELAAAAAAGDATGAPPKLPPDSDPPSPPEK